MIITEEIIKQWVDPEIYKKAKSKMNRAEIEIDSIDLAIDRESYEETFVIYASIHDRRKIYPSRLFLSIKASGIDAASCTKCGLWYESKEYCVHHVMVLLKLLPFFKEHPISRTNYLIRSTLENINFEDVRKQSQVEIEPVLNFSERGAMCEFKIGNKRKYVIRNLSDFIHRFYNLEMFQYGKELKFIHDENNIQEISLPLYHLIKQMVEEIDDYDDLRSKDESKGIGKELLLHHKVIDRLFDLYNGQELASKNKEYPRVTLMDDDPLIFVTMSKKQNGVVALSFSPFVCIRGTEHGYVYDKDILYRVPDEMYHSFFPFLYRMQRFEGDLMIDEADMQSFYKYLLPLLEKYTQLTIEEDVEIENYAPPVTKLQFYFDYEDNKITLVPHIIYGDKDYILGVDDIEGYRDEGLETKIIKLINESDFLYHAPIRKLVLDVNEEKMFEFLSEEISKFEQQGEVYISDRLERLNLHYAPRVSVGVRIESDLLKLDIDTEDIDLNEVQDILKSYRLKKKYHRLKNGQFVPLEDSNIETLATLYEDLDLKDLAKGSVELPLYRALYLDRLLNDHEGIDYRRDGHFKSLLRDFKTIEESDFEVPESLRDILRPYQKFGYRWLKMLDHYHFGGILADDMGLGKTLQMIAFLLDYYQGNSETLPSLIVTPASLIYNWQAEFEKFAPELHVQVLAGPLSSRKEILNSKDYDILVTSYDLLKRDIGLYNELTFAYEILDEAQYIKNSQTLQTKAVKAIQAKQRFALTGTPIENRLSELWSIFDFLMPGYLYPYKRFKQELETAIVKNHDESKMQRLQKLISPFVLRRLKKDVLHDLPEKIEKVYHVSIEGEQKKLYDSNAKMIKAQLGQQNDQEFKQNKIQVLAMLTRLRQLCCDPQLVYEDYQGGSAKLDQCLELIESCIEANHKILLFSQFTTMLDIIKEELNKRHIASYMIKGDTKKEKRLQYVEQFNKDDTPIFLISLKAGGTGLNLVGADIVIHYDPWWNVATQNQATDRAHRIGQKNVVTVYQMVTSQTIEEKIVQLQQSKQELASQVISGEFTSISDLSKEDLMEILSS